MESFGLMECVMKLHREHNVKVEKFILDDDATTKAYLKHSYRDLIDAGQMEEKDWPRTSSNRRKDDKGKLPLSHPEITFLANINHRVRTFGNALWRLKATGKRNTDCTRVDCQHLKRNFSYWIWRYNGTTLEEFRE